MRSELAKNTLQNLCRTLSILASSERQAVYEREVPFVDVPAELLRSGANTLVCWMNNPGSVIYSMFSNAGL